MQTDFEKLALELAGQSPSATPEPVQEPQPVEEQSTSADNLVSPVDSTVNDSEPDEPDTATPDSLEEADSDGENSFDEANIELDDFSVEEPEPNEPTFDFSTLSNDLGLEIKSKDELVSSFKNLKEEVSKLKEQSTALTDGVPENLQKAIELAKNGGDYMSYLGINSVDYSAVDPVELFEYEVTQLFTDEKGNVNEDELTEYLDNVSDIEKKLKGKELQQNYINKQIQERTRIEQETRAKKEEADKKLQAVINSTSNIAGFKVKSTDKERLFNEISSGKMINELFYDKSGNYDFSKIVDNYFKIKNFDKIQNFYQQRVKTLTKKEVLQDLTNPNVNTPPKPTNPTTTKQSPLDAYLSQLQGN